MSRYGPQPHLLLNSEFSNSLTGCHTKIKELSLPKAARSWRVLMDSCLSKGHYHKSVTQTVLSRIWTRLAMFIFYDDNSETISLSLYIYIYIYIYTDWTLPWWFECSPMSRKTWFQSQIKSYQSLRKLYLMPPCLTLSIIRYISRVKWSNPGKGVAPSPTPWCSSYWKGSLWVTLNYSHQIYLLTYIYIYNSLWWRSKN